MKIIAIKIISIFLLQILANNASAHVYLNYPLGGETFDANTIVTIQWYIAIPHDQLNWDLLFSTDGGETWQPIQLDLPVAQTTYTWVVPSVSTSQARISIIQDNTDMDYQDETMNFTIVPMPMTPFIDITAQNLNLECNITNQQTAIQDWLNNHGGATAVGFCGDLEWTHDYVGLSNDCGATGNAFVTFTAMDSCGSAETSAYLTVGDTQTPVMQLPAVDIVVECGNNNNTVILNNWLANHGGAIATDACGNVTWSHQASKPSNGCGITGSTSVIFIATDECGNSSTTSADFSVEDSLAPGIQGPAQDYTISCGTPDQQTILQNWLSNQAGAIAIDDCGNVTWTNNYSSLNDGCGATGSALVTFTVTDDCGNSAFTTANFAIVDNIPPVITVSAKDTTINCADPDAQAIIQHWLSNHGGASATDDCGLVLWAHDFPALADSCIMPGNFTVNFTASDECSNSDTTKAIITLAITTETAFPDNDFDFKISPNPVRDIIKITFEKIESFPVQIFLFNSQGMLVYTSKENAHEIYIPVNSYAIGIYFVQVKFSQGTFTRKFAIN